MSPTISFSEELDRIFHTFPTLLHCISCEATRLMKIDRSGVGNTVYRCTACGKARDRELCL